MAGGAVEYSGYHAIVTAKSRNDIKVAETNPAYDGTLGRRGSGIIYYNGAKQVTGLATYGAGDRLMMAFNPSTGQVWTGVNGTWDDDPSGTATYTMSIAGQNEYWIALQGRNLNDGQQLISDAGDMLYKPAGITAIGDNTFGSMIIGNNAGPGLLAPASRTARTTGVVDVPANTEDIRIIMEPPGMVTQTITPTLMR